jgi:Icc-related predicted phosphoesterase
LKIVAISDSHCRHHSIKLPKGDVLVHAGDVSSRGLKAEVQDFLQWFAAQPFQHKIFIAGNHDFFFEKSSKTTIASQLPEGIHYLNDSGIAIDGVQFWGSPVTPFFHNWAFNRQRGSALRKHWDMVPEGTDVLITHGPPFGILDQVLNGRNNGDKDLLPCLERVQPKVHLFGHIHESYGKYQRNGTRFFNCSQLNESYELVNKPFVVEVVPKAQ